jgi:glycosyltransferase involved in cell wall biosynthesis
MKKKIYNPLVSVIMNCHNGEKYLLESISSLIAQNYKNWELIFWDNNSVDNSKKIVKRFKDKRIKYFKSNKFNKLYHSRNLAINKAKGKYIGFLDVDDLWEKTKLQKQINFLSVNQTIKVIYSNFFLINELTRKKRLGYKKNTLPAGFITQKILNHNCIGFVTTMIEKNIFKNNKFNNKYDIIGDFDFFVKISQKFQIGCIQSALASYRIHSSNLSEKKIDLFIKELKSWLNENQKKLRKMSLSTIFIHKTLIKLRIKYYLKFLGM